MASAEQKKVIAQLLREYMQEQNLSASKLAKRIGVSRFSVLSWIDEMTLPSGESLELIAATIGLTLTEIRSQMLGVPIENRFSVAELEQEIRALSPEDFRALLPAVFSRIQADLESQSLEDTPSSKSS